MKKQMTLLTGLFLTCLASFGQITWHEQESGTNKYLTDVFFINETTGWITGWTGTILYTEDGGNQWTTLNPPPTNAYETIWFVDDLTGWAAGYAGRMIHTTDGGENWTMQESGTEFSIYDIQFLNADTGWAISSRHESFNTDPARRIHKTTNGGETWNLMLAENDEPPLLSLFFVDAMNGYAVGETGTVMKTIDGGDSWTELMQDFQYHFGDVYFVNPDTGFVVGTDLSLDHKAVIFKTADGGENWDTLLLEDDQALSGVFFTSESDGWAVGGGSGEGGIILRTEDGGESWEYQDNGGAQALSTVCFVNGELGWAAGYNGTIVTTGTTVGFDENPTRTVQELNVRAYPVPFDRNVNLSMHLEKPADVEIMIFDTRGAMISREGYRMGAGEQELTWNAEGLMPGLYYYRVMSDGMVGSGKLIKQ